MFIRKQVKNGREYWFLVKSYRDGKKVRHLSSSLGYSLNFRQVKWDKLFPKEHKSHESFEFNHYFIPSVLDKLYKKYLTQYPKLRDQYKRFLEKQENFEQIKKQAHNSKSINPDDAKIYSEIDPLSLNDDPYKVLSLEEGASLEQVKMRYRELVLKFHPDKGGDSYLFQLIQKAFETIEAQQKALK